MDSNPESLIKKKRKFFKKPSPKVNSNLGPDINQPSSSSVRSHLNEPLDAVNIGNVTESILNAHISEPLVRNNRRKFNNQRGSTSIRRGAGRDNTTNNNGFRHPNPIINSLFNVQSVDGELHNLPSTSVNERNFNNRTLNSRSSKGRQVKFNVNAPVFQPQSTQIRVEYNGNDEYDKKEDTPNVHVDKKIAKTSVKSNKKKRPIVDVNSMSLRERLIFQLENSKYECMICFQNIGPRQKVWSCKACYHLFHISGLCIIEWAKKSRGDDGFWACPTCKFRYDQPPIYYCYCGKQKNPITKVGERPHSCGNICGKKRGENCRHPCNEPCHPGPCPDCVSTVSRKCSCGAITKMVRCGQQVKCNNVCGKFLNCGVHQCAQVCHEGTCDSCMETVLQNCYCGEQNKEVICDVGVNGNEMYSCLKLCQGKYNCNIHSCNSQCHDNTHGCGSCPTSPERITHCPCGRKSLLELNVVRGTCEDSVPTCENICGKVLQCGDQGRLHRCKERCHLGKCPPCPDFTSMDCRCGSSNLNVPCVQFLERLTSNGDLLCNKRCRKKKTCGFHRCQDVCCVQGEHICMQLCSKRLNCGLHSCENICHSGQCPPCLNANFNEQFCHCGKTVRLPPIACGEPPPYCEELCAREHSCEHPVSHRCHSDPFCPPCTVLVERMCYGNHEKRKNIPCHFPGISCGKLCGKPLPCGLHSCDRNCHPGECFKENDTCQRPCLTVRSSCEHPCAAPCHPNTSCPDSKCTKLVNVTCDCGRRKAQMKCYESISAIIRLTAARAKAEEGKEISNECPTPGVLKRSLSMENLACISCNDDCKKVARNKKLADALSVVVDEDGDMEEPTVMFTESLKDIFRKHPIFVAEIEAIFCSLYNKLADPTSPHDSVSHSFRPMHLEQRRFVHEYAGLFYIMTVSVDVPPKRSVIATAKRGLSRIPLVLLTDLKKYPSILKAAGSTTLRRNANEEMKKASIIIPEEGMKTLKSDKKVYKRTAVTIAKPQAIKQQNFFSVLGDVSDESDEEEVNVPPKQHNISSSQKDPNWWSDDEDSSQVIDEARIINEVLDSCINAVLLLDH